MPQSKGRVWELPSSSRDEGQVGKKWSEKTLKAKPVKSNWIGQ